MLVGQLSNVDKTNSIEISFHDESNDFVLDNLGDAKRYVSNRHDLGYVFDILVIIHIMCHLSSLSS